MEDDKLPLPPPLQENTSQSLLLSVWKETKQTPVLILTRRSFFWDCDPAQWDFPQTGRHLEWSWWYSSHTSPSLWRGQTAPFLLCILLSCRWFRRRSSPCRDEDITQRRLSGRILVQGHCAAEAHMAAGWQLVKLWLCCFCSSLFFYYLCLKCHHGPALTEHSWSQQ